MTGIFLFAMAGGLAVLGYIPLPKDKAIARGAQGAGAAMFTVGLVGLIWTLMPQLA